MENFKLIKDKIEEAKSIFLTAHVNPDGDAVGASLALFATLRKNFPNKEIRIIFQDEIPYTTKFLKNSSLIEKIRDDKEYKTDLLIFLDSATRERTGKTGEKIEAKFSINIDHHISNPKYADINCVIPSFSSTSELIYNFIKYSDYNLPVEAAEAIYLGIVNDTGNFSHNNVTVNTMRVVTDLIEMGVNNNYIVENFLNSNSYSTLKLLGEALREFKYFENEKLSYFILKKNVMEKYGAKKEDTEGIVEKLLSYNEAEVSLFLREEGMGIIKGSMRSKSNIDVNKIANNFGGGGHYRAAGFSSKLSEESILEKIKDMIVSQNKA